MAQEVSAAGCLDSKSAKVVELPRRGQSKQNGELGASGSRSSSRVLSRFCGEEKGSG